MIYFTADTHFGHANIIKYCNRPFSSVGQMDEVMILNWNGLVRPADTVYHLGDFAHRKWRGVLRRLNGTIFLIPGDHDRKCKGEWVLPKIHSITYENQQVVLCHYLMYSWPRSHFGTWLLHGHHHKGVATNWGKIMNVGVDLNDFHPVSWLQVVAHMRKQPDNWNLVLT